MSMVDTDDAIVEPDPKYRYDNHLQNYCFREPTELTVVCDSGTRFLHRCDPLGISAGELLIESSPIFLRGELSVPRATSVTHDPTFGDRGRITIRTDF